MDFILEERVEKARDLFRQGYNCSQSVFLAYNDLLGVESTLAATISGPLGGGMGRLREVCGAVSGMSLIAGFLAPCPDPAARQAKAATYALVQEFAERFRAELGPDLKFYATGNLPRPIREACRTNILYRETLITDGLYRIWLKNKKG